MSPAEPSSSVATGGSDETGNSGKGNSGTCHVCGGALRRGNLSLARQCAVCKTRFHASDCGRRRSNAGYDGPYDVCPKCNAQCKCVGGMTKCHTSTVRVARIRKRVAASSECTGEDKGSAGARRTSESVWVRRVSASDPGLGGEPTDRSSLRSSAMHHDRSLPDTLNEAVQLCEPVFEEAQMEPRRGAHKAEPRRKSPAARDASPAFALPMDDNFDWSAALLRVTANDAGDGVVDETRIRTDSGAAPRDDGRFGGSGLRLDANSETPSPPFGGRAPDFPGVAAFDFGGDGEGGHRAAAGGHRGFPGIPLPGGHDDHDFTVEHARMLRDIVEGDFLDEKGN